MTAGLTEREATARLANEGRNELLVARSLGWTTALARQLVEVVILVLLVRTEALAPRDVLPCVAAAALAAAVARLQSRRPDHSHPQPTTVPAPRGPSALTTGELDGQSAR